MPNKWERLHSRLSVKATVKKQVQVTDTALDRFEKDFNLKLPVDYREFAKVFGPGELAGVVRVYAPVGKKSAGDLATFAEGFKAGVEFLGQTFRNPKVIQAAVPFANTIYGDMIVWNVNDRKDEKAYEYAILLLSKEKSKVVPLANDFETFIADRCLSPKLGKYLDDPDFKPEQTFVAFDALRA